MVRGRARAEFSLRVKTTYTCPSLRPKASIFTQDTHVDAVAVTFLTVKNNNNNLFMNLNNYNNNSFNIYGTLKIFSKHFHTYNLIWSFQQPCEVGWASISSKFGGWGNWGKEQLGNLGLTGRCQSLYCGVSTNEERKSKHVWCSDFNIFWRNTLLPFSQMTVIQLEQLSWQVMVYN